MSEFPAKVTREKGHEAGIGRREEEERQKKEER
jgi:hypothetical protein